jgi:hypothetical protein
MASFNIVTEKAVDSTAKIANNMQTINTLTANSVSGLGNFMTQEQALSNLPGSMSAGTSTQSNEITIEDLYQKYISNTLPTNLDEATINQINAYKNSLNSGNKASAGSPEGWWESKGTTREAEQQKQNQYIENLNGLITEKVIEEKSGIDKQAESINIFDNAVKEFSEAVGGSSGDEGGGSGGGGGGSNYNEGSGEGSTSLDSNYSNTGAGTKGNMPQNVGAGDSFNRRGTGSASGDSFNNIGNNAQIGAVVGNSWGNNSSNYSGSTGSYQNQNQNTQQNNQQSNSKPIVPDYTKGSEYTGLYYGGGAVEGRAREDKIRDMNAEYQRAYYSESRASQLGMSMQQYRRYLTTQYTSNVRGMGWGVTEAYDLGTQTQSFFGYDLPENDKKAFKVGQNLIDRSNRDYANFVRAGMVAQAEKINKDPKNYFSDIPYNTNIKNGLSLPQISNNTNNSSSMQETKNITVNFGGREMKMNPTLNKKAEEFSDEAIAYNGLTTIG